MEQEVETTLKNKIFNLISLLKWALTYVETEHNRGVNLVSEEKLFEIAQTTIKEYENELFR